MNEGSYFNFYDEFGSLCTAEWAAPGLIVVLDTVGTIQQGDAPIDGQVYGRQDGEWTPITATSFQAGIDMRAGAASVIRLYMDPASGDLMIQQLAGPNAGKSVNLTYGKWQ